MKTRLISVTPNAEKTIMYTARVSNPNNQESEDTRLLTYCIKNGHWSIFEMADMIVEIETSRAIAAQILRHRSFNFQEFSQRYSEIQDFEIYDARRQDFKNRQNSIDDMSEEDKQWFKNAQLDVINFCETLYEKSLQRGIAKELSRMLLPLSTQTRLYMKGNVRSFITYLMVRLDKSTQLEHRKIAEEIWKIFKLQFPIISEALIKLDEKNEIRKFL